MIFKLVKSKKGMTLIELVVGLLMMIVIIAAASMVVVPIIQVYARANALAECNSLLDSLSNQIVGEMSGAVKPIAGTDTDTDKVAFYISDTEKVTYTIDPEEGVLCRNNIPILSKLFYKNKSASFSKVAAADESFGTAYTFTLTILSDRDGEMVSREYAVKPFALNQYTP